MSGDRQQPPLVGPPQVLPEMCEVLSPSEPRPRRAGNISLIRLVLAGGVW